MVLEGFLKVLVLVPESEVSKCSKVLANKPKSFPCYDQVSFVYGYKTNLLHICCVVINLAYCTGRKQKKKDRKGGAWLYQLVLHSLMESSANWFSIYSEKDYRDILLSFPTENGLLQ